MEHHRVPQWNDKHLRNIDNPYNVLHFECFFPEEILFQNNEVNEACTVYVDKPQSEDKNRPNLLLLLGRSYYYYWRYCSHSASFYLPRFFIIP